MQDKDKLIIVAYVCTSGMNNAKASTLCCQVREHLRQQFDETVKTLVFPTNDTTHVEAINPKFVAIEYNEQTIKEAINKTEDAINSEQDEVMW